MKNFFQKILLTLVLGVLFWIQPVFAVATLQEFNNFSASSPAECTSSDVDLGNGEIANMIPKNCLFLEEPIGGKPNYDLYYVHCEKVDNRDKCQYSKWSGNNIAPGDRGPIQAILTSEKGKEYQGPFGLLYNYLTLIYNYMSGLILGFSVLLIVIEGVKVSVSADKADAVTAAKGRIIAALVGILIWFTASVILYTINPTFFSF